jgi:hypothetical protein
MFVSSLSRISNVSQTSDRWDYKFNWLGLVMTYRCEPDGGKRKLSLEVEYEVPQQQLARLPAKWCCKKGIKTRPVKSCRIKTLLEASLRKRASYGLVSPLEPCCFPQHNRELVIRMLRLT